MCMMSLMWYSTLKNHKRKKLSFYVVQGAGEISKKNFMDQGCFYETALESTFHLLDVVTPNKLSKQGKKHLQKLFAEIHSAKSIP